MRNEHGDDLASTVDTSDDIETHDYPKTNDDFESQEQEEGGIERGERDDESDDNRDTLLTFHARWRYWNVSAGLETCVRAGGELLR